MGEKKFSQLANDKVIFRGVANGNRLLRAMYSLTYKITSGTSGLILIGYDVDLEEIYLTAYLDVGKMNRPTIVSEFSEDGCQIDFPISENGYIKIILEDGKNFRINSVGKSNNINDSFLFE